jgi:hypothetical protein
MLRQPFADARLLLGIQPHTLFGTTPDGIIQAAHPLVLNQIFQLGFIKLMAEIFPRSLRALASFRISSLLLP